LGDVIINNLIRKKHFRRLRAQLKGARTLRKENRPFFVEKAVSDLTDVHLGLNEKDFPRSLVGSHSAHAEILLRQILLKNYKRICSLIMQSKGSGEPASLPAPNSWVNSLESGGLQVNQLGSKITLYKFSAFCLLKGFAKTGLLLLQYKLPALAGKPYALFLDLSPNNLPLSGQKKSYDIISWYKSSKIKKPDVQEIWAQIRKKNIHPIPPDVIVCRNIFPCFKKWSNYFQYFYKSFMAFLITCFGMIRGKWWYGLLYEESALLHYVDVLSDQDLAREYLLHNSNWFHKSLWTYEAEIKGSDVCLYYYSTNMEKFNFGVYQKIDDYGLKIMQWNRIIVWDAQQRDYLKQYCPNAEYQIVGLISFSDSDTIINNYGSGVKIAVFDVTPTRPILYTSMGYALPPYWSTELSLKFFSDIASLQTINDTTLLWKRKRTVGHSFINRGFILRLDKYLQEKKIISVDPTISARRLIEKCDVVISMPFTSTSVIGKELGKPSIFYDASASIEQNESHGIPVLKSKDELKNWYHSLNIEKTGSSNA